MIIKLAISEVATLRKGVWVIMLGYTCGYVPGLTPALGVCPIVRRLRPKVRTEL